MNYTTLASMTAMVRARMNLTNVNQLSDAEIQLFLNDSSATFYEMLVSRWKDYYLARYKISLAAGRESYPIPEDFRACKSVFLTFNQAGGIQPVRSELKPFNMNEFSAWGPSTFSNPQYPIMYRIMGESIYFTPVPTTAYNNAIEMWYIPQYKPPASATVPVSRVWPNGWERWVVFDTCVAVSNRLRMADYYAMFSKERDTQQAIVLAAATIRDEEPQMMTDAYAGNGVWFNAPGTTP